MSESTSYSLPQETATSRAKWTWLILGTLWLQLFFACSNAWMNGEYYDFGWYVPPAALWFFYRRWQSATPGIPATFSGIITVPSLILLAATLLVTRTLWYLDPAWRLPLWLHAVSVLVASHFILASFGGWKFSWRFLPVTLFALTCVPYPTALESKLVQHLTDLVVGFAEELFNLAGVPVLAMGDRLEYSGKIAEVADGCSGIRSFQSFLMAAFFFGELNLLRLHSRILLVFAGLLLAISVNTARAMALANIVFKEGHEAAEAAHGRLGAIAFVVTAILFFALAELMRTRHDGRGKRGVSRKIISKTVVGN